MPVQEGSQNHDAKSPLTGEELIRANLLLNEQLA